MSDVSPTRTRDSSLSSEAHSPARSISTSDGASKTAASSSTSEGMTANEADQHNVLKTSSLCKSAQKARATSPSVTDAPRTRPKLTTALISKILSYYGPLDEVATVPRSLHQVAEQNERLWALRTFSMLRFRANMLELVKIDAAWEEAVKAHPGWNTVYQQFLDVSDMRRAVEVAERGFFRAANSCISSQCVACVLNYGIPESAEDELFPLRTPALSVIKLCDDHTIPVLADSEEAVSCCNVCLGGPILGEWAALAENEDRRSFPAATNTCAMCRFEALHLVLPNVAKHFPRLSERSLKNMIKASRARKDYVEYGQGSAWEVAHWIVEDIWLAMSTQYERFRQDYVLRKRYAAQRDANRKRSEAAAAMGSDSESEEEPFAEEDIDVERELHLRAQALDQRCMELFYAGHWMSPVEQVERFASASSAPPSAFGITGPVYQERREGGHGSSEEVKLPPLPPPGRLLNQMEHRWWIWVEETLKNAYTNLANHIQAVGAPEDRFHCGNNWQASDLLERLQDPVCWVYPNENDPPKSVIWQPRVPTSILQLGNGTLQKMENIWYHVSAPLRECYCNICSRSKRKRGDEEAGRQSPQGPRPQQQREPQQEQEKSKRANLNVSP